MTAAARTATGDLTEILTIPEVASRARWHRARMWRHLVRLNRELGGFLLVNVSHGKERPRWTVSLVALKLVHPQWFQDHEALQRQIDEIREDATDMRRELFKVKGQLALFAGAQAS